MKEEGLQKTPNGLINIARPLEFDEETFWQTLDLLYDEAYSETDRMKEYVRKLVPTYTIEKRDLGLKASMRESSAAIGAEALNPEPVPAEN